MISDTAIFWSYLIALIPSLAGSLFVLYQILSDRSLRQALNNHVIILILIIGLLGEMTNYPWMLYSYRHERQWKRSRLFCEIWGFLDWGLYITHTVLFAWATIERHILIFHDRWVSTRKKRIFAHYFPPLVLLAYVFIFYASGFFFPSCENLIDNSVINCVVPCLTERYPFGIWEVTMHLLLPVSIILVCSLTLLLRVLWQKRRLHQPLQWRKHRKMTIQLLSISLLYIIFYLPSTFTFVFNELESEQTISNDFEQYSLFICFFMMPLFPFVCIPSLPGLQTKLINIFHLRRQKRRISPAILNVKILA